MSINILLLIFTILGSSAVLLLIIFGICEGTCIIDSVIMIILIAIGCYIYDAYCVRYATLETTLVRYNTLNANILKERSPKNVVACIAYADDVAHNFRYTFKSISSYIPKKCKGY